MLFRGVFCSFGDDQIYLIEAENNVAAQELLIAELTCDKDPVDAQGIRESIEAGEVEPVAWTRQIAYMNRD